jgi:hypothetical protein
MIWPELSMSTYLTLITVGHVAISLVAIAAGFVVLYGLLQRQRLDRWTALFLATTVATSATGFAFPVDRLLPSHVIAFISLAALAVAIYAWYGRRLEGAWQAIYVVNATIALYLNVFVLIVQSFLKVPVLKSLAPTQSELPFIFSQVMVLAAFVALGILATVRFQPERQGSPAIKHATLAR